jgi:parallel beta-helix repeat protein
LKKGYRNAILITIILFVTPIFESWTVLAEPDGAVIIHEDGSVTGTNKILQNDNIYTLTGDISITGEFKYSALQILKDGITIDGAHFSITTDGSCHKGITMLEIERVTIKNLYINNFREGIRIDDSSNNRIINNIITGYNGSDSHVFPNGMYISRSKNNFIASNIITQNENCGILIQAGSSGNSLIGNTVSENNIGIDISYNGNNILRNNQMKNNRQNFQLSYNTYDQFLQDIDSSNTIDEKPIIYWVNEHDKTVPTDASFVGLGNCTKITIRNLQFNHTYDSITMINTDNSVIDNNNIEQCGTGILIKKCQNVTVTRNNITGNIRSGIEVVSSENIFITENSINQCINGISTSALTDSTIAKNVITNCNPGMDFDVSRNNIVSNNLFEGNIMGIILAVSFQNIFVENTFIKNTEGAFRISDASDNSIYHNNFIENTPYGSQIVTGTSKGNIWDNGFEGNYWSNYQTKYSNASMTIGKRVWTTWYELNSDNIDHYPLVVPFGEPTPEPSFTPEVTQSEKTETMQETTPLWIIITFVAVIVLSGGACAIYFFKRPK